MKQKLLVIAVATLGLCAFASCSQKDSNIGKNAANDESVVGATDGLQTDSLSASQLK